ncbi:sensor histidine kinase [Jannaschia rubra]|uniref:sensor histidine kinase n=1 Tax=Jannaschia rubra TaxID=282197 RepID=UPI0024922396|nr:HWE histidine kinase domain-containing protein [Jannaschia rubra]
MADDGPDFEALFRMAPVPLLVLDRSWGIVTANAAYLDAVGRTLDDIRGQHVFDAFPGQSVHRAPIEAAFRATFDGEPTVVERLPYAIPDADAPSGMREVWWTCRHEPVVEADGSIDFIIQKSQNVTDLVRTQELKDAITAELQHRVGNLLTLMSVIAKRTAATSDDLQTFLSRFEGRIQALARIHADLTGGNWDRLTLDAVVTRQLADYHEPGSRQITITGPQIELTAMEAQSISMAIHELTTNSVKHGALRSGAGKLAIDWERLADTGYALRWQENGLGAVQPPERSGFGSMILDQIVPSQLRSTARREFGKDDYRYEISVPVRPQADVSDGAVAS